MIAMQNLFKSIFLLIGNGLLHGLAAIQPGCRCFLFRSAGHTSTGVFYSPNYPNAYPADIDCIIYTFLGNVGELVELTFTSFHLRPPQSHYCRDYINLYLNLEHAELNEFDKADVNACGDFQNLPQTTFYSRGHVLIMEFHTTGRSNFPFYHGFVGTFAFKSKDSYKINGQLIPGTSCDYEMKHFVDDGSTSSGSFFSPAFPQNYASNTQCAFFFQGLVHERVMITFRKIDLENSNKPKCDAYEGGDYILLTEGHHRQGHKLARLCGQSKQVQVISHGPLLLVDFHSDAHSLTFAQGFHANFEFVLRTHVQPTPFLDEDVRGDSFINVPPYKDNTRSTPSPRRIIEFLAKHANSGSFRSPNYPQVYPPGIEQHYRFLGLTSQLIMLKFEFLQLDYRQKCTGDKVRVYDSDTALPNKLLGELCGSYGENVFWTTQSSALVIFTSDNVTTSIERGFKAAYRFESQVISPKNSFQSTFDGEQVDEPFPLSTIHPKGLQQLCEFNIYGNTSASPTSGTIIYPDDIFHYNDKNTFQVPSTCTWIIYASPTHRIRLQVLSARLAGWSSSPDARNLCTGENQIEAFSYHQISQHQLEQSEVLRLCRNESVSIMSGSVSRLTVRIVSQLQSPLNRVHLLYQLTTDYGVVAEGGFQETTRCAFRFYSVQSLTGNFTSPNYPGFYPTDIVCEYYFHVKSIASQRILINFQEFDLENSDIATCSEETGDFLEIRNCPTTSTRIFTRKRLCRSTQSGSGHQISWPERCLLLRFYSNSQFVRNGFRGVYKFDIATSSSIPSKHSSERLIISLLFTMSFIFLRFV